MDEKEDISKVPPPDQGRGQAPNPPPAGDKGKPTPNPSQEGNKSDAAGDNMVPGRFKLLKEERDYTRAMYQNLMRVVELLDKKSPMLVSQKQIQEELGLSKSVVYDICWNLCKFGWAKDDRGDGKARFTRWIFFR